MYQNFLVVKKRQNKDHMLDTLFWDYALGSFSIGAVFVISDMKD